MENMSFWNYAADYTPAFLSGFAVNFIVVLAASAAAIILGIPLAFGQLSRVSIVRWVCCALVMILRGLSPAILMFVGYYGVMLPLAESDSSATIASLGAFMLVAPAYAAETFRSAMGRGAQPCRLDRSAWSAAIPGLINQILLMLHLTALLTMIAVQDLFFVMKRGFSLTFDFVGPVGLATAILLIVAMCIQLVGWLIERALAR